MTDHDGALPESPGNRLARWLHALAREVERDPDLAARVAESAGTVAPSVAQAPDAAPEPPPSTRHARRSSKFGPPTVAGRAAELGTGVPDPFAVRAAGGEDGLRRALMTLRAGSLRAIIRVHGLDPQGKLGPNATERRLVSAIVAATRAPPARRSTPKKSVASPGTSKAGASRRRPAGS